MMSVSTPSSHVLRTLRTFALAGLLLLPVIGLAIATLNQQLRTYRGLPALTPQQLTKNDHVKQTVKSKRDQYQYDYIFRDHKEKEWHWRWYFKKSVTDAEIAHFGLPEEIFKPYVATQKEIKRRQKIIRDGLFKQEADFVNPDYDALVGHYMPFTFPIYQLLEKATRGKSRREKIEFLMKFVQDIPYGIPPDRHNRRVLHGLNPPPTLLTETWGDCDSKAILFASILSHDPSVNIVFLAVPDHLLLAIEDIPRPYQQSLKHRGKTFVLVEATGPGRFDYGDTGAVRYTSFNQVIPIKPLRHKSEHSKRVVAAPPALAQGRLPLNEIGTAALATAMANTTLTNQDAKQIQDRNALNANPLASSGNSLVWADEDSGTTDNEDSGGSLIDFGADPAPAIADGNNTPDDTTTDFGRPDSSPETGESTTEFVWVDESSSQPGIHIVESQRRGNQMHLYLTADVDQVILASMQRGDQVVEDALLTHRRGKQVEVIAIANGSGRYDINLFAKPLGSDDDFMFVENFAFEQVVELGNNTNLSQKFPLTFGQFVEGGVFLEAPLHSPLPQGGNLQFRLRVPDALKVAVAVGDDFIFLEKSKAWFDGQVNVGNQGEVVVLASYDDSGEFHGLARYNVATTDAPLQWQ